MLILTILKYLSPVILVLLAVYGDKLKYDSKAKDGRTTEHKKTRKWVVILGILGAALGVVPMILDDLKKSESKRQYEGLKKAFDEVTDIQTKALREAATNPAVFPATIREQIAVAKEKELHFEEVNTEKYNSNTWREEHINKLRLARLNREQEEIASRDRREAEEAAQRARKKQDVEMKKATVEQYHPYVDYTVTRLRDCLRDRAGKTLTSNFPKDTREMIESGKHYEISEGEKSAWTYDVLIKSSPIPTMPQTLTITCRGRVPDATKVGDSSPTYTITATVTIQSMPKARFILTQVNIDSKASGDVRFPLNREPLTNYKKAIDSALRDLIAAQDEQISASGPATASP